MKVFDSEVAYNEAVQMFCEGKLHRIVKAALAKDYPDVLTFDLDDICFKASKFVEAEKNAKLTKKAAEEAARIAAAAKVAPGAPIETVAPNVPRETSAPIVPNTSDALPKTEAGITGLPANTEFGGSVNAVTPLAERDQTALRELVYLAATDTAGYIKAIFEPGDWVNIKTIHQTKTYIDKFGIIRACTNDTYGTLDSVLEPSTFSSIAQRQIEGWNAYVTMNAFTPGVQSRKKSDVKRVRTLYLDFDHDTADGLEKIRQDIKDGLVPVPAFRIQSSPNKAYVVWLIQNFTVEQQEALLRAMQQRYGSDSQATDVTRVLRLPGTQNLKYPEKPFVTIESQTLPAVRWPLDAFKMPVTIKPVFDREAAPEKVQMRMAFYEQACDDAGVDAGELSAPVTTGPYAGSYSYLVECPDWEEHTNKVRCDGSVWISPSGRISYSCWHEHEELQKRLGGEKPGWANYYRPWLEEQAEANGHFGSLKFGDASEVESSSEYMMSQYSATQNAMTPEERMLQIKKILYLTSKQRVKENLPFKETEALNMLDALIYVDLKEAGRFFNVDGLGYFIEPGNEDKPVKISPGDLDCNSLLERYHLHAGRKEKDPVGRFLGTRAFIDGEQVTQHISFHYDPETMIAYYSEQRGTILKVTKDGITRIKNGDEGVLFTYPSDYVGWTFNPVEVHSGLVLGKNSALYHLVFESLDFEESDMANDQKHLLLMIYMILLFLPNLNQSKIILQLVGPTAAGKSHFLSVIGHLVVGPDFKVITMPGDTKEFENQIINNSFLAYDNVNAISKQNKDLLCATATGVKFSRRELFTTAGQVEYAGQATIAMSGITPVLDQQEHANRSLVIKMKKRPEDSFVSSIDLFKELDKHRNELMSELVSRVQKVLVALSAQKDYSPRSNMRLADVAAFLLRIARHEDWENEARKILSAWSVEQEGGAMEDDEISEAMAWMIADTNFRSSAMSAGEFKQKLIQAAQFKGIVVQSIRAMSSRAFSAELKRNEKVYATRYGLIIEKDTHTKNNMFQLKPSKDIIALIRRVTVESLKDPDPNPPVNPNKTFAQENPNE